MSDVALVQSTSNNGNATPATTGSITANAGNLLVAVYTALGTNPTVATPTGGGTWLVGENVGGTTVTTALFYLPNNAGGAINPSSVLGGTITGWVAAILEFDHTGSNSAKQFSRQLSASTAAVTNIMASQTGSMIPQLLFVYAIGRATNVFSPTLAGLGPSGTSGWSSSIQPQAGVQGLSQDIYWGTNMPVPFGYWPNASGSLASAAAWKAAIAWFNTIGTPEGQVGTNIAGNEGLFIGPYHQGIVGG